MSGCCVHASFWPSGLSFRRHCSAIGFVGTAGRVDYAAGITVKPAPMSKLSSALVAICVSLTGCANVPNNATPAPSSLASRGVSLSRELPAPLPKGAVAIPGASYVLVNADSAVFELVDMINPIPFVADAAKSQFQQHAAAAYKARYAAVDPFEIASSRLAGSPLIKNSGAALVLRPLVYMVEGADGRWRLSLAFRVEDGSWTGRYMYHLTTTYTSADMKAASDATLGTLRKELILGSDALRNLLEREARGELRGNGTRVEFGSYFVVGSNVGGVVPARLVHFHEADLLDEGPDHVVLRSRGDLHGEAANGALAFGVHYFRKDQLHDFKEVAPSKD